jgi:hypothetical protein
LWSEFTVVVAPATDPERWRGRRERGTDGGPRIVVKDASSDETTAIIHVTYDPNVPPPSGGDEVNIGRNRRRNSEYQPGVLFSSLRVRHRRAHGERGRVIYATEERSKESVGPYAASRAFGERLVYLDGPRTTGCSSSERAFPTLLREWLLTSS